MGPESGRPSQDRGKPNGGSDASAIDSTPRTESPETRHVGKMIESATAGFRDIFEKFQDPDERLTAVRQRLEPFFTYIDRDALSDDEIEKMRVALDACTRTQGEEQFVGAVMNAIKPMFDVHTRHPDKLEEALGKAMNASGGFTEVNRLVSYGKSGSTIHIHHTHGKTVDNKRSLYADALKKLAKIVNDDPEVRHVVATSWIVAEHPALFTRSGFRIEDVSDESRREHFGDDEREVKMATIDREEFLARFLARP